jgi:hypothetical protein
MQDIIESLQYVSRLQSSEMLCCTVQKKSNTAVEKQLPASFLGQKSNSSGRNCIDAGESGQEPGLGVNNRREGLGLGVNQKKNCA